jgi:hypothetical protein
LSSLWYVTRSTRPASTSWIDESGCGFMRSRIIGFAAARTTCELLSCPNQIPKDGSAGSSLAAYVGLAGGCGALTVAKLAAEGQPRPISNRDDARRAHRRDAGYA